MNDVIIVGAGVVGCSIARCLSRYELDVLVLEGKEDVASGASKANSAIVHAGFDAEPGSNKAKYNVRGNEMFEQTCRELHVPFIRNTSLVVAFSDEELPNLQKLYDRGIQNGVKELRIIDRDELRALEPNVSKEAVAALLAPTGGICCPYDLTFRTAENAAANGVKFLFNKPVKTVKPEDGFWTLVTEDGETFQARAIVNASGVSSAFLNNQVSATKYNIQPRRGEYVMLDKSEKDCFKATMFQCPGPMGKGVLVSPTVDGTIIVGPTSEDIDSPDATETTAFGLDKMRRLSTRIWTEIPFRKAITTFSGIRAHETTKHDFVLGEAPDAPGFFNALGVESPGLTSAPAIGVDLAQEVATKLGAKKKETISDDVSDWPRVRELSPDELNKLIEKDPRYGRIICRCETISEAEIRASIRCRVGATTIDGIKRRTRATMGRCQGGFCTPRLIEILADELGVPQEQITKAGGESLMVLSRLFPEDK